jgi:hypothetical protein
MQRALVSALIGLAALSCAGHSSAPDAVSGVPSVAGAGNFGGGTAITDPPEVLGASPVKCAGVPVPDASIVRACLLLASCDVIPQVLSVSECIAGALPTSGGLPECLLDARTCAEVGACRGRGIDTDACLAPRDAQLCVGNRFVDCGRAPNGFVDCTTLGATCVPYRNEDDTADQAGCGFPQACPGTEESYRCAGTKRVRCDRDHLLGEDCAARGLVCVQTPTGAVCRSAAGCEPDSGQCDASGSGTYCDGEGQAMNLDCSRLGFTCQAALGRPGQMECAAPSCSTADAAQCFEECDGPMAHLCLGGQRFSVDCHAYGLKNCFLETRSESGDRARCGYD